MAYFFWRNSGNGSESLSDVANYIEGIDRWTPSDPPVPASVLPGPDDTIVLDEYATSTWYGPTSYPPRSGSTDAEVRFTGPLWDAYGNGAFVFDGEVHFEGYFANVNLPGAIFNAGVWFDAATWLTAQIINGPIYPTWNVPFTVTTCVINTAVEIPSSDSTIDPLGFNNCIFNAAIILGMASSATGMFSVDPDYVSGLASCYDTVNQRFFVGIGWCYPPSSPMVVPASAVLSGASNLGVGGSLELPKPASGGRFSWLGW